MNKTEELLCVGATEDACEQPVGDGDDMKEKYPEFFRITGLLASRAMERKVMGGEIVGKAPRGYRYDREDGPTTLVVDWEIVPLLLEAFQLASEATLPLRQQLSTMTERGLRSPSGKPYGISSYWKILTNPFYYGQIRYKGKLVPGNHEPLITPELFATVQRNLAGRQRR